MKFDIKKLKKDMKEIAIPIVAISLFIIIINSKFGKICPLRTVSYTHLDVYKRQVLDMLISML